MLKKFFNLVYLLRDQCRYPLNWIPFQPMAQYFFCSETLEDEGLQRGGESGKGQKTRLSSITIFNHTLQFTKESHTNYLLSYFVNSGPNSQSYVVATFFDSKSWICVWRDGREMWSRSSHEKWKSSNRHSRSFIEAIYFFCIENDC